MTSWHVVRSVESRKALVFALVLVMPMFAGCNVKDWYNQEGYVSIELAVDSGKNTTIDHFKSIKAQVYGVDIKQRESSDQKHFTFGDSPLIVDLVDLAKKGESVHITEFKTNLRATEKVAIRIVVFEVFDAAGNPVEVCRLNTQPEKFPCFYQPDNAALLYDEKQFSPPRGGTVEATFPVTIQFATKGRASQYFLFADSGQVELAVRR